MVYDRIISLSLLENKQTGNEKSDDEIDWFSFEDFLRDFRGLSESTIEQYLCQAKLFYNLCDPFETNEKRLFKEINYFVSKGNKAFSIFALKNLFLFLEKKDLWDKYYALYGKKIRQKMRKTEIKALRFDEINNIRNLLKEPFKTILTIQYETGCRVSEILNLLKKDVRINEKGNIEFIIRAKGGENRILTVTNKDAVKYIISTFSHLNDDFDIIFNISARTYNRRLKEASLYLYGKEITSHWIRHSRGVHIYNKTKDILAVKTLLGHKSLESTLAYLRSAGLLVKKIIIENKPKWKEETNIAW